MQLAPSSSVVKGEGVLAHLMWTLAPSSDGCGLLRTCTASLNPFNVRLRLDRLWMNGGRFIGMLGPASSRSFMIGMAVKGAVIERSNDRGRGEVLSVASLLSSAPDLGVCGWHELSRTRMGT